VTGLVIVDTPTYWTFFGQAKAVSDAHATLLEQVGVTLSA